MGTQREIERIQPRRLALHVEAWVGEGDFEDGVVPCVKENPTSRVRHNIMDPEGVAKESRRK